MRSLDDRAALEVLRQTLAAVVAGAVSFTAAATFAVLALAAVFWGGYGLRVAHIASSWWVAQALAILATGVVVSAFLFILFDTAARLASWLRAPRWFGVAVAGVPGGAALHVLLIWLTFANSWGLDVTFPYWWMDTEIHFG